MKTGSKPKRENASRKSDARSDGVDFSAQLAVAREVMTTRRAALQELAQIELAERIMREDRNILRKLAD